MGNYWLDKAKRTYSTPATITLSFCTLELMQTLGNEHYYRWEINGKYYGIIIAKGLLMIEGYLSDLEITVKRISSRP